MAVSGIADVASTIQKVVSAMTTQTLIQESVALQMAGVWDRSAEVGPGMDRLDMIELAELSVQTVDELGAAMTPQSIAPGAALLLLDQHKSVPFSVTKRGELQSKIALVQRTVENGVRSLAAEIDDYIFAECVANAGTSDTAAGVDGLTAIRRAAKAFDQANVPKMGRAIAASPGFMYDLLLANSNVIRANEYGSAEPIRRSAVVSVYGFEVFESSSASLAADGFLALGMEACAFARQRAVDFEREDKVLEQRTDYAITHLYGAESTAASNPRIYNYDPV